jgi:alpha-D-ribose 1-methylphosphonate 5-triphosphate synthase subunit PhnH
MRAQTVRLEGGFAEPALDSQRVFRAVMDAMARPGTIAQVDTVVSPPGSLSLASAALICALCDVDTPLWLDPLLRAGESVEPWVGFQTGAPISEEAGEARFAIIGDPSAMPSLDRFAQGSQEYPDRSATLILQVASLDEGRPLALSGPGIRERATFAPRGLPDNFIDQWAANGARFPRGVDLIFSAGGALACLPRTTRIMNAEG